MYAGIQRGAAVEVKVERLAATKRTTEKVWVKAWVRGVVYHTGLYGTLVEFRTDSKDLIRYFVAENGTDGFDKRCKTVRWL